jgi:hypothetical protein
MWVAKCLWFGDEYIPTCNCLQMIHFSTVVQFENCSFVKVEKNNNFSLTWKNVLYVKSYIYTLIGSKAK